MRRLVAALFLVSGLVAVVPSGQADAAYTGCSTWISGAYGKGRCTGSNRENPEHLAYRVRGYCQKPSAGLIYPFVGPWVDDPFMSQYQCPSGGWYPYGAPVMQFSFSPP